MAKQKAVEKRAKGYKLKLQDLAVFTQQLASMLEKDIHPDNAWRVGLDENERLYWESSAGRVHRQPAQSGWQRAADWFFGLFPLANQI